MKKYNIWSLMALCLCLFGALAFTACGDDDEDNGGSGNGVQGTWTYAYTLNDTESRHGVDVTLTLGDKTYELKVIQRHSHDASGDFWETFGEGERGNYTFADGRLSFTPTGISFYESINDRSPAWSAWEDNARDGYTVSAALSGNKLTITQHIEEWYWAAMGENANTLTLTRK